MIITGMQKKHKSVSAHASKNGFSLIEIVIVVAVLSLLAMLAVQAMLKSYRMTQINKAKSDIAKLHDSMKSLIWDTGYWPGGAQPISDKDTDTEFMQLDAIESSLMENSHNHPNWDGPYMDYVPRDPWGNSYFLDTKYYPNGIGQTPVISIIGSLGPGGKGQPDYHENNIYEEISP